MYNNTTRIHRNTLYNNYTYTKAQVMITKIIICLHKCTDTDYNNNHAQTTHKYLLQFKLENEKMSFQSTFESGQ